MKLQSALSLHQFAGLDEFGRRIDRDGRRRRRKRGRRRRPPTEKRRGLTRKSARGPSKKLAPAKRAPSEVIEAEIVEPTAARRRPWSPAVSMGPHLRIQAAEGYRAAVIELKPGLFIVAEVPEHVARSEFGIAPLLAPLVVRAATKAIATPPEQRLLPKLVQAVQQRAATTPAQAQPASAPGVAQRLLTMQPQPTPAPTPAAQRQLVPAAGAGHGHTALLPAPVLGRWVDEDDLAGLFGCESCDGGCGRHR
jgi:hypothetical protein